MHSTSTSSTGVTLTTWQRCMNLANKCTNMRQLKAIHAIFIARGLHHNNYALSRLVTFCALHSSGSLSYAKLIFHHSPNPPNSFLYNTLIQALSKSTNPSQALHYFKLHPCPSPHSFHFALSAAANARSLPLGTPLHASVLKNSLSSSDPFVQTALLRLYALFPSSLVDAHKLFDEIPHRDAAHWNVLISAYVCSGSPSHSLLLFNKMLVSSQVAPDQFCIATALAACAHAGALTQGKWIHQYAKRKKVEFLDDVFIGTSLVDMYAKCGCIDEAVKVFNDMPKRNAFSWAAMVGGFAMHGYARDALRCLERMNNDGLRPDGVVILNALVACSHAGLEEEARRLLTNMEKIYGVAPKHEHYSCLVDLLCRAGQLGEAMNVVRGMPMRPLASVWGAVLSGSRIYGDVRLAEVAAEELMRLEREGVVEEEDDGVYVQLANVYMKVRRREDARWVRGMMGERGMKKTPGCSVIEVDGEVNEFVSGDERHPLRLHIHCMLQLLRHRILCRFTCQDE